MKRVFLIIVFLVAVILLTACNSNESEIEIEVKQENQEAVISQYPVKSFVADPNTQYIRSNYYRDQPPLPVAVSSLEELYDFYKENKKNIDLWHNDDSYSDTIGFINAVEKYDEQFFELNALVFVFRCQGSGSIRHNVSGVMVEEDVLYVDLDVLQPEIGTADMAEWIIIIEIPKNFTEADSIEVNSKYVNKNPDYHYLQKPEVLEFVSDDIAVKPYEETLWFEGYDEEGNKYLENYSRTPLEELINNTPELVLGKELKLNLTQRCNWSRKYVVYNEKMKQIAAPVELSAGTIARIGPGTYYLSVEIEAHDGKIDKREYYRKVCYIKVIVPEKDYGMAKQLSELGEFVWSDIDRIAVECTANDQDGQSVILDWDNGFFGIARMITLLRDWGTLTKQQIPAYEDWEQRVVFYKGSHESMSIYTFDYGLYIKTQGRDYALEAPPWLFDMLVEAAATGRIITFNEAVEVARKRIIGLSHEEHIDDESIVYGYLQRYGYKMTKWVIMFKPKEGSGTGVKFEVISYRVDGIDDIVFD